MGQEIDEVEDFGLPFWRKLPEFFDDRLFSDIRHVAYLLPVKSGGAYTCSQKNSIALIACSPLLAGSLKFYENAGETVINSDPIAPVEVKVGDISHVI
jgi:hypothetical protein